MVWSPVSRATFLLKTVEHTFPELVKIHNMLNSNTIDNFLSSYNYTYKYKLTDVLI